MRETAAKLAEVLSEGISDECMVKLKKQMGGLMDDARDDLEYRLKEDLASHLSGHAKHMADEAIKAILQGDEDSLRRYLSCRPYDYTGRREKDGDRGHPVIHGSLHEQGSLLLRKQIVDAFPELLKSERILDLEAQVASLVAQVNRLEADKERMRDSMRGYA